MKQEAILLLGPTGSGKTPAGELIEERGFGGHRCYHFDFGLHLRNAGDTSQPHLTLDESEKARVAKVLALGELLKDHDFPIASKILQHFITTKGVTPEDLIVLNGLPRHAGQADDVASVVNITTLILLDCSAETVLKRIRTNAGGDRAGRTDDEHDRIIQRIERFNKRTIPLLDYYREKGAKIVKVDIGPTTNAKDVWNKLS